MTTNLFPLPYGAPALKRVPLPLQVLDAAYASGDRASNRVPLHDLAAGFARLSLQFPLHLSPLGRGKFAGRKSGQQGEGA